MLSLGDWSLGEGDWLCAQLRSRLYSSCCRGLFSFTTLTSVQIEPALRVSVPKNGELAFTFSVHKEAELGTLLSLL